MAGYYTSKRSVPFQRNPRFTVKNASIPGGGNTFSYQYSDTDTVTSYRTRDDLGKLDTRFGQRDPFEVFYAYGSWRFDTGHPFQVDHLTTRLTHPVFYMEGKSTAGPITTMKGPLVPDYGLFGSDPIPISAINSNFWGARLINLTIPTNPVANVLQSLAELKREGIALPGSSFSRLLQSRTSFLRSVGGEYLNVAFGWIPLVNDLVDVLHAVIDSRKILENLEKNSGLDVRRKRTLDEVVVVNNYSVVSPSRAWRYPAAGDPNLLDAVFDGYPAGPLKNGGPLERTDRVTEQYSFSGAYSYYFENGSDPISKLRSYEQKANLLLGTRLTPEVLWELAPWSWLADWFANFGTLSSNVSRFAADGLVMKYGYLMRHSVSTRIYTQNGVVFRNANPGPFAITLKLERKERVRATPFGFGLNPNSFTGRQWSILAALGLTKSPRGLP